jgi:hypothetical protein
MKRMQVIDDVEDALRKARALCEPDARECAVEADVKRRVRPYVMQWIIPDLERALRELKRQAR